MLALCQNDLESAKSFAVEEVELIRTILANKLNFQFLGIIQLFCDFSESYRMWLLRVNVGKDRPKI